MSSASATIRGSMNTVVTVNGNGNVVGAVPFGANVAVAGDGAVVFPVRLSRALLRRVALWGRLHGATLPDALARLVERGLDAEGPGGT